MSTPSDEQPAGHPDTGIPGAAAGSPPSHPDPRDWHALAEQVSAAPSAGSRSSRRRARTGPQPGQLSLGDLAAPASPASSERRTGPAPTPMRLDAPRGSAATGVGGGEPRGILVSGRFPATDQPASTLRSGDTPEPGNTLRPGDWSGVGVTPGTVAFELPPPALPEDDGRPPTLPVFSSQVLERRLIGLRAGQTVEVESGEYRGTLTIRTPVTLRASGGEVRIRSTTGPAILLKGCGATLTGLTVQSDRRDAIVVESGAGRPPGTSRTRPDDDRLELTDCCVSGAGSGIVLGTALVRLGLDRCVVTAGDGDAIALPFRAVAVIAASEITSRAGHGIAGGSAATLGLVGTTISGCGGAGIRLDANAKLWLDDGEASTITGNHGSGIALGPNATGALGVATLTGNGGWGLIAPGGDVSVRTATIADNGLGDVKVT